VGSVEVHDLRSGMDTRIGAPSADAPHRGTRHDGKGVLKGILHSAPIGLCLPTPKPAAIIFKTQNDAHGRPLSKTQHCLAAHPPASDTRFARE